MKYFLLLGAVFICTSLAAAEEEAPLESIFNGKDLAGWKAPAENIWWKAADGVLQVRSGPNRKGSNLWTEKQYGDFVMECEFKLGEGTVDSGVFVRNDKEQIQIGISGSLKRDMTASPYIAGKGYPVEAKGVAKLLKADDWNHLRIRAEGPQYTVWLNGEKVMTYESPSTAKKGPIGIQLHGSRDMSIDYRNLKAAELK
jgi:hypothetical protein